MSNQAIGEYSRRLLCKLGIHNWTLRELHIVEPVQSRMVNIKMCVIDRCKCGASRMAPSGGEKQTMIVLPTKYKPTNDN
jgi:hypothetical protein